MDWRVFAAIVFAVTIGPSPTALASSSSSDAREFDSWETREPTPAVFQTECFPLDALMQQVVAGARDEAIKLLADRPYVPIDAVLLSRLLPGEKAGATERGEQSAQGHEARAKETEAFARRRLDEPATQTFSAVQAARERYMAAFHRWAASQRKPYLARGVALNEGTGAFSGLECNGYLLISHGSLGRSWPQPLRRPLVVYLLQEPIHIYVSTSMAE